MGHARQHEQVVGQGRRGHRRQHGEDGWTRADESRDRPCQQPTGEHRPADGADGQRAEVRHGVAVGRVEGRAHGVVANHVDVSGQEERAPQKCRADWELVVAQPRRRERYLREVPGLPLVGEVEVAVEEAGSQVGVVAADVAAQRVRLDECPEGERDAPRPRERESREWLAPEALKR